MVAAADAGVVGDDNVVDDDVSDGVEDEANSHSQHVACDGVGGDGVTSCHLVTSLQMKSLLMLMLFLKLLLIVEANSHHKMIPSYRIHL